MYKDIQEKLDLLNQKKPSDSAFTSWVDESSLWGWIFTCLILRGTPLEKGVVVSILRGEIMENVPLELYGFVHRYRDVYKDIKSSLGMKNSLTEKLLNRYYCMLFEKKQAQYRENNPVVYEWGYNPPHFRDIGEQTDLLFHRLATEGRKQDPLTRAALFHMDILKIYPYGPDSVTMAGVALLYILMESGIPVPHLFVSEQEYHLQISQYLNSGDAAPFSGMLGRSIINRLDVLLQVSESAEV